MRVAVQTQSHLPSGPFQLERLRSNNRHSHSRLILEVDMDCYGFERKEDAKEVSFWRTGRS